jgi:hypothetical protein
VKLTVVVGITMKFGSWTTMKIDSWNEFEAYTIPRMVGRFSGWPNIDSRTLRFFNDQDFAHGRIT